jgi:hypothetical protein
MPWGTSWMIGGQPPPEVLSHFGEFAVAAVEGAGGRVHLRARPIPC